MHRTSKFEHVLYMEKMSNLVITITSLKYQRLLGMIRLMCLMDRILLLLFKTILNTS